MDLMSRMSGIQMTKDSWLGLAITCFIGLIGYATKIITKSYYADPLLVAMILGILARIIVTDPRKVKSGFIFSQKFFIPVGIVLYGAVNLNFGNYINLDYRFSFLLIIVMLVYFTVIFWVGRLLKQRDQITFLTATGSAICGASAIAITSPAVESEPDDISISLISVFIAASFGIFIFIPFLAAYFGMSEKVYALLCGMTLQFTGFVKAACGDVSKEAYTLGVTIKATRYLGLFVAIPLFASFTKHRFYIPFFLWLFLAAGVIFSFMPLIGKNLIPVFKPCQEILWSIAMAGIGLNADIRALLSDYGLKALLLSFCGFTAAAITFLIGFFLLQ